MGKTDQGVVCSEEGLCFPFWMKGTLAWRSLRLVAFESKGSGRLFSQKPRLSTAMYSKRIILRDYAGWSKKNAEIRYLRTRPDRSCFPVDLLATTIECMGRIKGVYTEHHMFARLHLSFLRDPYPSWP